jgi:hypothetical protein
MISGKIVSMVADYPNNRIVIATEYKLYELKGYEIQEIYRFE